VPQAAAFVSIDSVTGGYHAMVGGFDYNLQKFNHVTQAWRQPGSSIKPFVYSAALEKGFRRPPINDVPLDLTGAETGNEAWSPKMTTASSTARSPCAPRWRIEERGLGAHPARHHGAVCARLPGKFGFDLAKHPKT
jgi:penicillin-binding protein 1A